MCSLDLFGDGPSVDRLMEEIKTDETTKSNIRKDIENSNSASEQWQILLSHQKGEPIYQSFFTFADDTVSLTVSVLYGKIIYIFGTIETKKWR